MHAVENGIRIVTILGTARPGNYTKMALEIVNDELGESSASVTSFDAAALELTFPGQPETGDANELKAAVAGATGIVLATPEYHGSFSSMLKLIIENLGFPSVLAGKPISLLGVAAGQIGAIKSLEQLRSVCSHVGGIVLPGPISVANVQRVFNDEGKCLDEAIEKRLRGLAKNLLDYVHQNICPRVALEAMVRPESEDRSAADTTVS